MNNLDVIILSTILSTLFVIFIALSAVEMKKIIKLGDTPSTGVESGPRASMIKFVGKLFDSPMLTKEDVNQKIILFKAVQRTISDMESDGVYFPTDVKEQLQKKRDELMCEYSGLPSVSTYSNIKE